MRRFVWVWAVTIIAILSPRLSKAGDQETAQQIADALRGSGRLSHYSISVKYQAGTAWLLGRVSSQSQMDEAVAMASELPDVSKVVNKLEIKSSGKKRVASRTASAPAVRSAVEGQLVGREEEPSELNSDAIERAEAQTPVGEPLVTGGDVEEPVKLPQHRAPSNRKTRHVHRRSKATPVGQSRGAQRGQQASPVLVPIQIIPMPNQQAARRSSNGRGRPLGRPISTGMTQSEGGVPGAPLASYAPGTGYMAPAKYDQPHMPDHAWPSYASYPNYAGVTYPKQYSPSAWPYIGPFYPYPQVPLGWRKVTLEWDDGWWFLDFKE